MKKILMYATIILFSAACNNTKLTSSWKDPNSGTVNKYNKILVVGLTGGKDRELRETVENSVAKKLQENNLNVQTATQAYGPKSFRTMTEDQAVKMVNDNGFDGVLLVTLLDKDQEQNYNPGTVTSTPVAVYRNRWYGNYSVLYDRVYNPGYYTTSTNYTLEANFYRTRGDKLIYSAQAKSFDPNSASELAGDFSKTVIKDMMDKGLIAK